MKLAIVGTRELSGYPVVEKAVRRFLLVMFPDDVPEDKLKEITEIVSGGARGVDRLAELFAVRALGQEPKVFEPTWKPSNAGNVQAMMCERNQEIVNYADAMVAIRLPDQSPGTDDAIVRMKAAGKPVVVFDLRPVFVEFFNGNHPATPG